MVHPFYSFCILQQMEAYMGYIKRGCWTGLWLSVSSLGLAEMKMEPITGVIRFDQAMFKEQTSTPLGAPANSANLRTFDLGSKVVLSPVTTFHWELNFANGIVGLNPTFVSYEGLS